MLLKCASIISILLTIICIILRCKIKCKEQHHEAIQIRGKGQCRNQSITRPHPNNPQIPPLREIPLNTRPLAKRALAWSCDGELAVAADDCVHVLVPLFPDTDAQDDEEHGQIEDSDDGYVSDDNDNDLRPAFLRQRRDRVVRRQAQFAGQNGQILTAHPRLDPRVNREIWEVAGLGFPYGDDQARRGRGEGEGSDDGEEDGGDMADDDYGQDDEAFGAQGVDDELLLFGAGNGPISSAGSGLNHVISVAWSPSGLGRNRRPILAVLTSAGYIGFYGDGPSLSQGGGGLGSVGQNEGMLKQRDMTTWVALFGVGEKLVVPGQDTDFIENIRSFAWAREIAPGQALLAYANDEQDIVVLSIQSEFTTAEDETSKRKAAASTTDKAERMVWRVQEVARFKTKGPHPREDVWDPDWVPCGTSFGLRWSPWLSPEGSRSCVLSYVTRNYVGFRKITVKTPWVPGTVPDVTVEASDCYGRCVFLSTDSFVEFEDAIWTKKDAKTIRGLIATGFDVKPFEVSISGPQSLTFEPEPHSPKECDTMYRTTDTEGSRLSLNPIVDLFIHPPNLATPSDIPTYTLVRLAATSTNNDWYQTNAFLEEKSSSNAGDSKPQWAVDLAQKLAVLVPADAHMRHQPGGDDDSDADSVASGGSAKESGGNLTDMDDDDEENAVPQGPEVHPTRFRLHGLVPAPGGKATAVLVSAHSTQTPDRTGWWGLRSTVMFGFLQRPKKKNNEEEQDTDPSFHRLTTEGRLWNWMYGAGPEVPGITTTESHTPGIPTTREIFAGLIASQTCDFCGTELGPEDGNRSRSICKKGHFFSTCGASGLAIQAPWISHTCGACGARTLKVEDLLRRAPMLEDRIREVIAGDVCGNCGGKFVD